MVFKEYFKSGDSWVWMNAGGIAICLVMVAGLVLLIAAKGLAFFWPDQVAQVEYINDNGQREMYLAEHYDEEVVRSTGEKKILYKIGSRDVYGLDFRWFKADQVDAVTYPEGAAVIERREWGHVFGFIESITVNNETKLIDTIEKQDLVADEQDRINDLMDEIADIQGSDMGGINYQIEAIRLDRRAYELDGELTPEVSKELDEQKQALEAEFAVYQKQLDGLYEELLGNYITVRLADGQEKTISTDKIVHIHFPNQYGIFGKIGHFLGAIWGFIFDEPREANTEGGVFPAIFGTVLMVILMSILVTPMGVVAAVYLREYAKQGLLTRIVRISVNNLAGVPSIVYGVFGLGFFVYFLGGSIDDLFYPEAKPAPTFGTPGLMWASLTLALLTLPVVIVSTEEGLARIPRSVKEGSLALGATKFETLWRTILPMASPAMMTGLILAIARAAGEVAPLMLVGVVKLAPTLPLDGNAPFLHLDRKFMHLGFHIYDVGFQSPNVEAARPIVYATALLLIVIIILLNLLAVRIRNNLREKYKALES